MDKLLKVNVRTTVAVVAIPDGTLVEIDCIAST
jgi:hypothetical protein